MENLTDELENGLEKNAQYFYDVNEELYTEYLGILKDALTDFFYNYYGENHNLQINYESETLPSICTKNNTVYVYVNNDSQVQASRESSLQDIVGSEFQNIEDMVSKLNN